MSIKSQCCGAEAVEYIEEVDGFCHRCVVCGKVCEIIDDSPQIDPDLLSKAIKKRLRSAGVVPQQCKRCGKDILFLPTHNGRMTPLTMELISHFADCPAANQFRKK